MDAKKSNAPKVLPLVGTTAGKGPAAPSGFTPIAMVPFEKSDGATGRKADFEKEPNAQIVQRLYTKEDKVSKGFQMVEPGAKLPASTLAVYHLNAHKSEKGGITFNTATIESFRATLVAHNWLSAEEASRLTPGKRGAFYLKKA